MLTQGFHKSSCNVTCSEDNWKQTSKQAAVQRPGPEIR